MKRADTYVRISRDELEEWLDTIPLHNNWFLRPGSVGVYYLPIAKNVGIRLSSTIGSRDDAMGKGRASMKLALVSLVTGHVLNKKAMGQSHFARTTNWRTNWRKGIDRMIAAFQKSRGFYEALAVIEDRQKYQRDLLARIEAIPGWEQDDLLRDFHNRIKKGGIITTRQVELIIRAERRPKETVNDELIQRLRLLWRAAKQDRNDWLMKFTASVGSQLKDGRPISEKQSVIVQKYLARYKL